MSQNCKYCGQPILDGEKVAHVADVGEVHARCGKVSKAHGREVEPEKLPLDLRFYRLEKWCRDLEKRVEVLERDTSDPVKHNMRIGGR